MLRRCEACPSDIDEQLLAQLKDWRLRISKEMSVPAYVVFTDNTLIAIAETLPTDDSATPDTELLRAVGPALARVPGSLLLFVSSPYARRGELYKAWREHWGKDTSDVLVVQAPTRVIGVIPQGGNVVDAVLTDGTHQTVDDHFGELGLIYLFGRTCEPDHVDIVRDGSEGGVAVLRAVGKSGNDDFLDIKGIGALPVDPTVDPVNEDGVECATTYILAPGTTTLSITSDKDAAFSIGYVAGSTCSISLTNQKQVQVKVTGAAANVCVSVASPTKAVQSYRLAR